MNTLQPADAVPTIGLRPDRPGISAEAFFEAGGSLLVLLREVGRSVSIEQTIAWSPIGLQHGSGLVALRPAGDAVEDASRTIARTLSGLREMEHAASRPEFFSEAALRAVRRLAAHTDTGSARLEIFSEGVSLGEPSVTITNRITANLDELRRPRWRAIGSVRGTLDMMTIHGMLAVHDETSGERIECRCSPELLTEAARLFGKRVVVRGEIVRDSLGRRLASATSLRPLNTERSPRAEDLRGLLADDPIDLEEWARYVRAN